MRNKVYRLYGVLVAVCLIVSMILPASAVPIIPDPGVSTDKSSICCGDEITVVVPVKNLRSVTKYLHIDIVIKNPSGSKIVDDSKPETIAAYASKTFYYTYTIPEPCTSFGTCTVEVRVMEGETLHDSDTTTFQVNDCNGGDENCDTQLTYDTSKQDRPSITYANNYFYVAYQSWETGESYNGDIFLKKFDSNWNEVKKEQITTNQYYQDSPSLVFANNKLYVALITNHQGATWDDYDVYLKEYDSNLNYISGSGRYLTELQSCQDMPSLFYKDGYFYLAYQSWESGSSYNGDIYIKKFDSSWNEIKKVRVTSETSVQYRPSVIYANGYLYIAYHSEETGSWDIFVKKLDTSLNLQSWKKQVTSESSSQSYPSINFVNDEYAIAYASNEGGTLGIYIKKYDSNWGFVEKVKVIDDGSVHEKRPSMVHALGDYQLAYVRYLGGSDDFSIYSTPEVCPSDEEPSPEITKVTYPTTCVNEDEYATISVTVRNNGGASSKGYISISFPNGEYIPESDVSGTGNGYNDLFPKGYYPLWNSDDEQITAVDPLVELFEANWGKGQQETISMKVKPNSGSDEIVFYVRAALKNDADGSYERDPTYSGYVDQQGWPFERHSVDVCEYEEVKIRGKILTDYPIISFYSFNVKIDEILDDPTGNLQEGETVNVYGHRGGPAQVDYVTVGDEVEVFGEYRGYVGAYEQIFLSDSDHYVKEHSFELISPDLTSELELYKTHNIPIKVKSSTLKGGTIVASLIFTSKFENSPREEIINLKDDDFDGIYEYDYSLEPFEQMATDSVNNSVKTKDAEALYTSICDYFSSTIGTYNLTLKYYDASSEKAEYLNMQSPSICSPFLPGPWQWKWEFEKFINDKKFQPPSEQMWGGHWTTLEDVQEGMTETVIYLSEDNEGTAYLDLGMNSANLVSFGIIGLIYGVTEANCLRDVGEEDKANEMFHETLASFVIGHTPAGKVKLFFDVANDLSIIFKGEKIFIIRSECPVNLHMYDSSNNHIGLDEYGNPETEIPYSIYTQDENGDFEGILIIDFNSDDFHEVVIEGTGNGKFNLTSEIIGQDKKQKIAYLNVPVYTNTIATIDVSQANPTYTMEIDKYGDGTTIETKEPDSIETIVTGVVPFPSCSNPPTDPDKDGLFEDINGNGRIDFNDVIVFFKNLEWVEDNEPTDCFDFNTNSFIDFDDMRKLFEEM